MKGFLFSWFYFHDRWNLCAKSCIVSIKRVCKSRKEKKFVKENSSVYGIRLNTVYTFHCSSHLRSHIFKEQWLAEKISDNTMTHSDNLIATGLGVQGIVPDSHSVNVNVFSALVTMFSSKSNYYMEHLQNTDKTYLFYDTVHLFKNVRFDLIKWVKVYISRVYLWW